MFSTVDNMPCIVVEQANRGCVTKAHNCLQESLEVLFAGCDSCQLGCHRLHFVK